MIKIYACYVVFVYVEVDWNKARFDRSSPQHILSPVSFDGKLAKALVPDDPRLAQ